MTDIRRVLATTPLEAFNAMALLWWGLWLALPWSNVFDTGRHFKILAALAPEPFWGAILLLLGLMQVAEILHEFRPARQVIIWRYALTRWAYRQLGALTGQCNNLIDRRGWRPEKKQGWKIWVLEMEWKLKRLPARLLPNLETRRALAFTSSLVWLFIVAAFAQTDARFVPLVVYPLLSLANGWVYVTLSKT